MKQRKNNGYGKIRIQKIKHFKNKRYDFINGRKRGKNRIRKLTH